MINLKVLGMQHNYVMHMYSYTCMYRIYREKSRPSEIGSQLFFSSKAFLKVKTNGLVGKLHFHLTIVCRDLITLIGSSGSHDKVNSIMRRELPHKTGG